MAKAKVYEVQVFEYDSVSGVETQGVSRKLLWAETVPAAIVKFNNRFTLPSGQFIGAVRLVTYIDDEFKPAT